LVGATAEPRSVARRALLSAGGFVVATLTRALFRRSTNLESGYEPQAAHGPFFRGYRRAIREILARPFTPRLATYPGRTLIVNGEHDALFHREQERFRDATAGRSSCFGVRAIGSTRKTPLASIRCSRASHARSKKTRFTGSPTAARGRITDSGMNSPHTTAPGTPAA
jgi:hypothetical protein